VSPGSAQGTEPRALTPSAATTAITSVSATISATGRQPSRSNEPVRVSNPSAATAVSRHMRDATAAPSGTACGHGTKRPIATCEMKTRNGGIASTLAVPERLPSAEPRRMDQPRSTMTTGASSATRKSFVSVASSPCSGLHPPG